MNLIKTLAASLLVATATAGWANEAGDPAATPGIDKRQARQEARIDQGIASGELTRREVHRLERQQNVIDRAEARAKADGTVTRAERHRIHHMQDRASGSIARQKHDRQRRGGN